MHFSARPICSYLLTALVAFTASHSGVAPAAPMPGPFPFSIPQYDFSPYLLSHDDQFIVVDKGGTDGNGPYAGQPDSVWLDDGTTDGLIVAAFPNGHGGPNTYMRMSEDGGLTWSNRLPTNDTYIHNHNAPAIDLMVAPDGTQYLNMTVSFDRDPDPTFGNVMRQTVLTKDPAKSWTEMLTETDINGDSPNWTDFTPMFDPSLNGTWGYKGHAPPKRAFQINDTNGVPIVGSYFRQYHDQYSGVLNIAQINTTDGGLTWSDPVVVSNYPGFPNADPAESEIIRSPDGTQLLSINRENSRQYESLFMTSNDEGQTWTDMLEVNPSLTGDRHIARYLDDGRIVMTFRNRTKSSEIANDVTYGDFVLWVGTYDDILNGNEGQYRVRLIEQFGNTADIGYAGLEILPDGTIVSIPYADWTDNGSVDNDVIAMRFTIEQLDALTDAYDGILGDINQDGELMGDGTGSFATDDVTAFIAGWLSEGFLSDIDKHAHGDLNFDGFTDLADAFQLHQALSAQGGAFPFELLVAVPEPGSVVLFFLGVVLMLGRFPRTVRRLIESSSFSPIGFRLNTNGKYPVRKGRGGIHVANQQSAWSVQSLIVAFVMAVCLAASTTFAQPSAPLVVGEPHQNEGSLILAPDGTIHHYYVASRGSRQVQSSTWDPITQLWSAPADLFLMPSEFVTRGYAMRGYVKNDGNVSLAWLDGQDAGGTYWVSQATSTNWGEANESWAVDGNIVPVKSGALRDIRRIGATAGSPDGRLVMGVHTAASDGTFAYSDDDGQSWTLSDARLTTGVSGSTWGKSNSITQEPVLTQLNDGRLWSLFRTNQGSMHETFSSDGGETWADASGTTDRVSPTRFYSTRAPARILRLNDNRLMVLWNNSDNNEGPIFGESSGRIYVNRTAMHAAISDDDGATWKGFREIYRDPIRNQTHTTSGDRGTAYPNAIELQSGTVLVTTGQGGGHHGTILIDPDWLGGTTESEDFAGTAPLADWSTFIMYGGIGEGPAASIEYQRDNGAVVVQNNSIGSANGNVLHFDFQPNRTGDAAAWNFFSGADGQLDMRLRLTSGFDGASIALTDHHYFPSNIEGEEQAMYRLMIDANGDLTLPDGTALGASLAEDAWHDLSIRWTVGLLSATVSLDGQVIDEIPLLHGTQEGISYLRLLNTGAEGNSGFYLDSVEVEIDPNASAILVNGDVNLDGMLDQLDIEAMITGWLTDTSGMFAVDQHRHGDLNLDGLTDLADVYLIHQALAGGGGAFPFEMLRAVPEPGSIRLLACGLISLISRLGTHHYR